MPNAARYGWLRRAVGGRECVGIGDGSGVSVGAVVGETPVTVGGTGVSRGGDTGTAWQLTVTAKHSSSGMIFLISSRKRILRGNPG
jgi:hypothetical protein